MKKLMVIGGILLAVVLAAGCGGSSGGAAASGDAGGGDSGTGIATVTTLSAIPSIDLSNLDSSQSASSNLAAPLSNLAAKSLSLSSKAFGEDFTEVGETSRAGCEANMHKQEMIRQSKIAQLERCYPEAMEAGGLIEIPTGSYAYYTIQPPEANDEQQGSMCEEIPAEDAERRAACEAGGPDSGSKAGMSMKMRIGNIDGVLYVDMCDGASGLESLVNEASYGASGSVYSINTVHIGNWGGVTESSSFSATIDLGTTGSVDDGIVTLGTDGLATATGIFVGGFGSGTMNFEALPADSSVRVYGAFASSFRDPFSQTTSSFTGKVYSRFATAGTAKWSFSGSPPAMRFQDMVPFNIGQSDLDNFLQSFGIEMGIDINSTNYQTILLCPNPDFDFENPSAVIKPMIAISDGETCPLETRSGIESFQITNRISTGDFGTTVNQTFKIIAHSGSSYYDEVSAYDLAGFDAAVSTPAFARNWDCSGDFSAIAFESMTAAQMATVQAKMQACFALEEAAFGMDGMGGYDCHKGQQMNEMDEFAEGGGGNMGLYGGEYGFLEHGANDCENGTVPGRLFVDAMVASDVQTEGQYCIASNGVCPSFTIGAPQGGDGAIAQGSPDSPIVLSSPDILGGGSVTVGGLAFYNNNISPEVGQYMVKFDYSSPNCIQYYVVEQHTFGPPPEFGAEGPGTAPGDAGWIPSVCLKPDGSPISESECMAICGDPQNGDICRPPNS